jgi:hypothetical protein
MNAFYRLNRSKAFFITKVYLAAFGALALVSVLIILYFFTAEPFWVVFFGVIGALLLTAFLVIQTLVQGKYIFERRRMIFGTPVLSAFFRENGFAWFLTNTDSKWELTDESMMGRIDQYIVTADLNEDYPEAIFFSFKTSGAVLNNDKLNELLQVLNRYYARLSSDAIIVKLNITGIRSHTQLTQHLREFSSILTKEGFSSQTQAARGQINY